MHIARVHTVYTLSAMDGATTVCFEATGVSERLFPFLGHVMTWESRVEPDVSL